MTPTQDSIKQKRADLLFVDDEPKVLSSIRRLMNEHRLVWNCHFALSASHAIDIIKSQKIDIVIVDYNMPGKNGFQATRDLSRNPATSQIPVIIITTKDQETDKIWGMRQGAKDYIVKPADESDLIDRINNVLN